MVKVETEVTNPALQHTKPRLILLPGLFLLLYHINIRLLLVELSPNLNGCLNTIHHTLELPLFCLYAEFECEEIL